MANLQTHPRVVIFIYGHSKVRDRKLLARAEALNVKLKKIDIESERLTTTHFASLADGMHQCLQELLDPRIVNGHDISDAEGVLKLINKNPELLKTPIVVTNKHVRYIEDFADLQSIERFVAESHHSQPLT